MFILNFIVKKSWNINNFSQSPLFIFRHPQSLFPELCYRLIFYSLTFTSMNIHILIQEEYIFYALSERLN